ncbi:hypothetical protein [Thermasporomyces composti]|nr:hypothetical protein [Thermasporomyces composti]
MPRTRLVLAMLAAGAVMFTGCSSNDGEPPADNSAPRQQNEARVANENDSRERELTPDQLKAAIGRVILSEGDIGHDTEVQNQDDSLDVPTNDVCGKQGRSDGDRLARNQDFFWKGARNPDLVVSNEAVAYKPGKGEAALEEIKKAVEDCDGWKHDEGQIKDIEVVDAPKGALEGSFAWRGTDDRKEADYSYIAVYQRNGDLLSAIYVWSTDKDQLDEVAEDLTVKAAQRLERALN